jgi:hypothetical protein
LRKFSADSEDLVEVSVNAGAFPKIGCNVESAAGTGRTKMLKVTIGQNAIQVGERFAVAFQRTIRIPDDDRVYPLPPGFGAFPIFKVEDFTDRVPSQWREQSGAFIPMYQREALWLSFNAASWKPAR